MTDKNIFIMLWLAFLLAGCGSNPGPPDEESKPTTTDSGIVLSREAALLAGIRFGGIEPKLLSMDVNARGQIQLLPQKMATVSVMVGGAVQSIDVDFGQTVKKGQTLATYSSHEFLEMQQLYINSKTGLEKVRKDFERKESLFKNNVISQKEFQEISLEYQKAQVDFDASKAEMELLQIDLDVLDRGIIRSVIPIVSPISGQVESIQVSLGEYVSTGVPIFKVINRADPILKLMIFEKDVSLVEKGQRVTFSLPNSPQSEYVAEIYNVGATVEPAARVVYAYARVQESPGNLIPGMFVATEIHTRERMRLALPESAVVVENEDKKYGFYSLDRDEAEVYRFYPISLACGFEEDGYIEVEPAYKLPENARMVIQGTYYLKSEWMQLGEE